MKRTRILLNLLALLLICVIPLNLTGCATRVQAADLMEGVTAQAVEGKAPDTDFIKSQMRLTVDLFRAMSAEKNDENLLISPLSIQLALAMAANGADGQTRAEMEALLSDYSIEELNEYLYAYVNRLPSEDQYKLEIANSIWFRDTDALHVEESFLQTNANYFGAGAYQSAFDNQTVTDINNWCSEHTDGMVDNIIDRIEPQTMLYLINAVLFDAEWDEKYEDTDVIGDTFTALNGEQRDVKMMRSTETKFISDANATGFIKDYRDGKYSFAALLPNEDIDIREYVAGLDSKTLLETLQAPEYGTVIVNLPKFESEYELKMNDVLAELGMETAFDPDKADLTKMAQVDTNLYISEVRHKTKITVNENGTKAAAITIIAADNKAASEFPHTVILDRPFVYMILDNSTNLPIFIGTVMDIDA